MEVKWLDRQQYPFRSHYLELEMGRMHYIDEGEGPTIVFVHGTPTWSFIYRDLIKRLSKTHRCIAADQIGFGLSDKPKEWSYRPSDHSRNLAALIEHLGLKEFTLVVHDYGGPIGLGYAVKHPEQISQLVIFNTWMWPFEENSPIRKADPFLRGPLGRWLYLHANASPRFLLPSLWGNKPSLTPALKRHYTKVHSRPEERQGMYQLALELNGSSEWYQQLWEQRERLAHIPTLLVWGRKDPSFGPFLARWQSILPQAQVLSFDQAGHFVMEEVPVGDRIEAFLHQTQPSNA